MMIKFFHFAVLAALVTAISFIFVASASAEDLNPQPLPPAKPHSGDPIKSGIDNRVRQLPVSPSSEMLRNKKPSDKSRSKKLAETVPNRSSGGEERAIIVGGKQATSGDIKK